MTGHLIGGPGSAATAASLVTSGPGLPDLHELSDATRAHYADWDKVPGTPEQRPDGEA